ncbi:MBL fold metallo-hydrolase [Falsirhodobacter xinxiangensis]|uniref:MBL fold metallo-hydrolase n=1 Tax=Falsirhodobacter xinxiangensis TaxID=2530049 RepID=UPI0010AB442F|nr:MBL fold metallo-hydrolase [Rhodobacter xinxiangensis]
MNRRQAILTGAAMPLATLTPMAARAQTAPPPALSRSLTLGSFRVTALLAGSQASEPVGTFALNAPPEEFAAFAAENFLPADRAMSYYTPVLVEAGSEVILFDTGANPAGLLAALEAAAIDPASITTVVITHMHGDHIGGLSEGGTLTFANANLVTGRVEMEYWLGAGNETFDAKVRPFADAFTLLDGDQEVAPGITAIEAFGHSPGHMAFDLQSEGRRLILTADTANHYAFSLGRPDWEVRFDMDKAAAAATRRRIFGMIADERLPFIGYHMPFPAVGYVARDGDNFRYMPATYQFDL